MLNADPASPLGPLVPSRAVQQVELLRTPSSAHGELAEPGQYQIGQQPFHTDVVRFPKPIDGRPLLWRRQVVLHTASVIALIRIPEDAGDSRAELPQRRPTP